MDNKIKCTNIFGEHFEKDINAEFEGETLLLSVEIPEGVNVVRAGQFSYCSQLNNVKLPSTIKEISENAFRNCHELEVVNIPDSANKIGHYAFSNCNSIKSIKLPSNLKSIEKATFSECNNLKEIVIPENVEVLSSDCFAYCEKLENVMLPNGLKKMFSGAFIGCYALKKIELPQELEKISDECFMDCEELADVKINDKCNIIGKKAFCNCAHLQNIKLGNGLEQIFSKAFEDCTLLNEIDIPDSVRYIGDKAFSHCVTLKKVNLPSNLEKINNSLFEKCVMLNDIELPEKIVEIGSMAFVCSGIKKLIIPSAVNKIGDMAFFECENLEQIDIPEGIKEIGNEAFYKCNSLKSIKLPTTLKQLNNSIFSCCLNLENVEFSNGLEKIGSSAFYGCEKISTLKIPKTVKVIEDNAFLNCNLNRIEIPKNCDVKETAFTNSGLKYVYLRRDGEITLTKERDETLEKDCLMGRIHNRGKLFFNENFRKNLLMLTTLKENGNIKFIPPEYTLELFPNNEIEKYYLHNNNLRYGRLVRELGFDKLPEETQPIVLPELLKIYYVLGGFSENQGESEKAYDYILNYVALKNGSNYNAENTSENIHSEFSELDISNGYNKDFAKFFMKYYKDNANFMVFNLQDVNGYLKGERNYLCSAYNSFASIEKAYPNMTINGTSRISVLTPKFVAKHSVTKTFNDVNEGNEKLALLAGKYGYNQKVFDSMQEVFDYAKGIKVKNVLSAEQQTKNDAVTFRVLEKDDPLGFFLGNITNCCQHIGGAGESCVIDGYKNVNSGFIVFEQADKDTNIEDRTILGQAYTWYDEETKTVCLDNIEVPTKVKNALENKDSQVKMKDFINALNNCSKSLIKTMNANGFVVEKVTTGMGFNDLRKQLDKEYKLETNPKAHAPKDVYSDAKSAQYVLIDGKEAVRDEEPLFCLDVTDSTIKNIQER